ncbi:sce7726 family protein [Marinobacterium jannaschii]|uniref:sce7726 family protein n=1 Tax=Marinobacterium jannaschii TaxID=64970 RepID=UPI0006851996|nr:sce7726 family protein [Marinobacterium jannaschii]
MNINISTQREYQLLSKVFSRSIISGLARHGGSADLERILSEVGRDKIDLDSVSLLDFFEGCFEKLKVNYRNEYVFKNAIATKIVRGRHKLSNCHYISEFKVGRSIADVAVFNGTSTAYEIKSSFDSFERLRDQIASYSSAFDKVYVVVPKEKVDKVFLHIEDHIGVYELTDRYSLSQVREAESNIDNICSDSILGCLRRGEYLNIVKNKYGYIPSGKPSEIKREVANIFRNMSKDQLHREFVHAMRKRGISKSEKDILSQMPASIISLLLSERLNERLLKSLYLKLHVR